MLLHSLLSKIRVVTKCAIRKKKESCLISEYTLNTFYNKKSNFSPYRENNFCSTFFHIPRALEIIIKKAFIS